MATNYPTSLDTSTEQPSPLAATEMDDAGFEHDVVHTNHSGAIIALETKVGTGSSTASAGTVFAGSGAGVSGWTSTPTLSSVTADLVGNADTATLASAATALATARSINGVSFDGTGDITVAAAAGTLTGATLASGVTASSLTSVGTLSGLTVSGDANFDSGTLFVDASSNRVGINTTSVSAELDVHGTSNPEIRIRATDGTSPSLYFGDETDNVRGGIVFDTSANRLQFHGYNNSIRMVIDSSGDVGIGTTLPAYRLDLNGDLRVRGTSFLENAGTGHVATFGNDMQVHDINVADTISFRGTTNASRAYLRLGDGSAQVACGPNGEVWLREASNQTAFIGAKQTNGNTGSGGNGYIGISNYCGGFTGTTAQITSTTINGVAVKRLGYLSSSLEYKSGVEDLSFSDEAFMSLKPITFHPDNTFVDTAGEKTGVVGGHYQTDDADDAAGLMPLKRAGFGWEHLLSNEETQLVATDYSYDYGALCSVLVLKLQEAMERIAALEAQ